jgi:hypothetical protein
VSLSGFTAGQGDPDMNNKDEKILQHAMTSFALIGGMFGNPRIPGRGRVESRPQDYVPAPRKGR